MLFFPLDFAVLEIFLPLVKDLIEYYSLIYINQSFDYFLLVEMQGRGERRVRGGWKGAKKMILWVKLWTNGRHCNDKLPFSVYFDFVSQNWKQHCTGHWMDGWMGSKMKYASIDNKTKVDVSGAAK